VARLTWVLVTSRPQSSDVILAICRTRAVRNRAPCEGEIAADLSGYLRQQVGSSLHDFLCRNTIDSGSTLVACHKEQCPCQVWQRGHSFQQTVMTSVVNLCRGVRFVRQIAIRFVQQVRVPAGRYAFQPPVSISIWRKDYVGGAKGIGVFAKDCSSLANWGTELAEALF
jgi:hypothetical protein